MSFTCILPWHTPSALNSDVLKSWCVFSFCLFALSKRCQTLESQVSIHVYCCDLLLHPGSIHRDDFYSLFTLPAPGRTFPSLYSKLSRCQYFPERAFLWHNLISPKLRVMYSPQYTSPQRSHPVRARSLWWTSVDFPHVTFPSLLERHLIYIAVCSLT